MQKETADVLGTSPIGAGAVTSDAADLEEITNAIRAELAPHRATGLPLKACWPLIARRLGISPRRARSYHNGEVKADDVKLSEFRRVQAARKQAAAADAQHASEIANVLDRLARLEALVLADRELEARHAQGEGAPADRGFRALASAPRSLAGVVT